MNQPKMNTMLADAVPEFGMTHTGSNSIRVRHREYLQDISSSSAFTTQGTFYINPGLSQTFPWLSQIASSFQQYKIHGLCAVFKSTSADAVSSTNAALGSVIVSFNFNPTQPLFTNKQQQLETDFACDEKPTVSFIAPMECARSQTAIPELYVRQTGLASNQNQQLYDMALMQVSTQGSQAVFTAGELWLTYDIELIKPITSLSSAGYFYHLVMAGTISTSAYFGTTTTVPSTASNFSYINNYYYNNAVIYFKWAFYSIVYGTGGSVATTAPTVTLTSGASQLVMFANGTSATFGSSGTTTSCLFNFAFTVTAPSAVITFSGATLPSSITGGDLIIMAVPSQGTA